jgi:hypothetical protein
MNKLLSSVAAAAFLFMAAGAHAAEPAAPAAASDTIPPAKQALLQRLDKAMNFDGMMGQMAQGMIPAMVDAQRKADPAMTDAQAKEINDVVIMVLVKYAPRMKAAMFKVYADVFTEDELKSLVEFYESPNGQAVLHKLPLVMQQYMPAIYAMVPDLQADVRAEMCKRHSCPAAPKTK